MRKQDYYSKKLSAFRLKQCYDIAPPRIQQYLDAEIHFVLENINPIDTVLELGCGYGRVLAKLARNTKYLYGIDTSEESLKHAQEYLTDFPNIFLHNMDVASLNFQKQMFDVVFAIQNGISAFQVSPHKLVRESIRVTKSGGRILLSSYSEKFWEARLDWFIKQSKGGLLGEIDYKKTKNGVIVCKDGFIAKTFTPEDFLRLTSDMGLKAIIKEVDESSIFCVIKVTHNH